MNPYIVTALLCLGWLAVALLAAHRWREARACPPGSIDLLERKLDALDLAVDVGDIDDAARRRQVSLLLDYRETLAAMQALVDAQRPHLTHARIVSTGSRPALHIDVVPGTLLRWREALVEGGFCEAGGDERGDDYRGPFAVRLAWSARARRFARVEACA